MSRDVVVLSAVRSAIGTFNGSLSSFEPSELGGIVMKEAVARSGVDPALINYITVGNTIPTDSRYAYVARVASIQAGLPMDSVAMSLNRLCSSGLQAIVTTAQQIMLGDCDYGIGGGVEVMSRGMYGSPAMRSGARMGDTKMLDLMVAVLTDRVKSRMHLPWNRTAGLHMQLKRVALNPKLCRSLLNPVKVMSYSIPMSIVSQIPRWKPLAR